MGSRIGNFLLSSGCRFLRRYDKAFDDFRHEVHKEVEGNGSVSLQVQLDAPTTPLDKTGTDESARYSLQRLLSGSTSKFEVDRGTASGNVMVIESTMTTSAGSSYHFKQSVSSWGRSTWGTTSFLPTIRFPPNISILIFPEIMGLIAITGFTTWQMLSFLSAYGWSSVLGFSPIILGEVIGVAFIALLVKKVLR